MQQGIGSCQSMIRHMNHSRTLPAAHLLATSRELKVGQPLQPKPLMPLVAAATTASAPHHWPRLHRQQGLYRQQGVKHGSRNTPSCLEFVSQHRSLCSTRIAQLSNCAACRPTQRGTAGRNPTTKDGQCTTFHYFDQAVFTQYLCQSIGAADFF